MQPLFRDLPEAITNTVRLAERLEFSLENIGYEFPDFPVPDGHRWIRSCARSCSSARSSVTKRSRRKVKRQLEDELDLIIKLGFSGYFLIVWDIVNFCREHNIMVQGRGSAANSAVCYCLGITPVDPVSNNLVFERFLSEEPQRLAGHRSRSAERRPARKRHPGSLSALRQTRRGHDRECHHLSRAKRGARNRQGAEFLAEHSRSFLAPLRERRFSAHARSGGADRAGRFAERTSAHAGVRQALSRRSTACRAISGSTPAG